MRNFWDAAASANAPWYLDTSISFATPDMDAFWETGRVIAAIAMGGPVAPTSRGLAVEIGPGLGRIVRSLVQDQGFERAVGVHLRRDGSSRPRGRTRPEGELRGRVRLRARTSGRRVLLIS